MTRRSVTETAAEVLRLDQAATPGPWRFEIRPSETFGRLAPVDIADSVLRADGELIATYRTAAPELAREVLRLQAAVAYRPGLPSMEQVAAHEARGGWWQCRRGERARVWTRFLCVGGSGDLLYRMASVPQRLRDWQWRPCLPDGTPCPWGDL